MAVRWLGWVVGGARRTARHPGAGQWHGESARWCDQPGDLAGQAPVDAGDLSAADADAASAGLCVQEGVVARAVFRLGDGSARHDPYRSQSAHTGVFARWSRRAQACWPKASGSSCFRKARALHADARASTSQVVPGWRSRPARRSFRSRFRRPSAGRARHSSRCRVWSTYRSARRFPASGAKPEELMREVEAWIEAEMHRLDPEAYR